MHYLPGARRVAGFLLFGLLAGCSGGSGGDAATQTQISTDAISFSAAGPFAARPTAQVFTATFGEDIAHLAVVHSGAAIASATSALNGRTATITVQPTEPGTMGPGAFTGAIAVTGYTCADTTCSRLSSGSTSTVAVSYQVSPLVQFVGPYVATAGVSDSVVIRGVGFGSFSITGARFGDSPATELAAISSAELRATYPALPAGTYTVNLDSSNHRGEIPTNATLVVVDPIVYSATTLSYPVAGTTEVRSLVYDAERRALLAVTDVPDSPIIRYPYANGAWGAPSTLPGGFLDIALSTNGSQLLALRTQTVVPANPVTLALGTPVAAPSLATTTYLKNLAVGNDNVALITTSGSTTGYFYDPVAATIGSNGVPLDNGTPAMAANGSAAIIGQGDGASATTVPAYRYVTANRQLQASTSILLRQTSIPPALDRAATRVVFNGIRVYDSSLDLLGTLPDETRAVVLHPNGRRAYTYNPSAGGIVVYDISVDREGAAYVALGTVPVVADPGVGVRMAITPEGRTLFLAGTTQIVVQPTPDL